MNQHVAKVEHVDPETGEITEVSPPTENTVAQVEAPAAEKAAVEAVAVPDAEKRKFPLQPILAEKVPPLPTPDADRIDPNWDIAQVATKGHVHLERIFTLSEKMFWPTIVLALLAIVLIGNGLSSSGSGLMAISGGDRGIQVALMFLPFFVAGVGIVFLATKIADVTYEEQGVFVFGGGALVGAALMAFWWYTTENPNSTAAWILFGVKVALAIGLVLWVGSHLIRVRRSGESKAIVWMAGAYVGFVIIGSVVLSSVAGAMSGFGPGGMQAIAGLLTYDRDTYFDLGGGLRSGPEYQWMTEYAPKGGLSVAKHNALIASVRSDLANHSNDAASWTEVTKLDPQPMITRAEKALRDNAKELPNGIVIIPEEGGPVSVVAYVEGQWSLSLVAPYSCAVFLGPFDPKSECSNETTPTHPLNSYAVQIINSIKPTPAAETKE